LEQPATPQRGKGRWISWEQMTSASSFVCAAFLVAFVLALIILTAFGAGERGTVLALRITARWSFILFWLAYAGGAAASLCGSRLDFLARRGREFGLAYASAQLIHVGLVFWIIHITADSSGAMAIFWAGIFCTYMLALFSWPRLREALGPRLWRTLRTVGLEYIAFVFAFDFIILPIQFGGGKYPISYLPFALLLVGGLLIRLTAFLRARGLLGHGPAQPVSRKR
jgi:hypothetical protein